MLRLVHEFIKILLGRFEEIIKTQLENKRLLHLMPELTNIMNTKDILKTILVCKIFQCQKIMFSTISSISVGCHGKFGW